MFPKITKDFYKGVAESTYHSEEDVKEVLSDFFSKFVPGKLRSLDTPGIVIYKFGKFFTSIKDAIKRRNQIIKIIGSNDDKPEPLSEEIMDKYKIELEKITNNIKYYEERYDKKYLEK